MNPKDVTEGILLGSQLSSLHYRVLLSSDQSKFVSGKMNGIAEFEVKFLVNPFFQLAESNRKIDK